MELNRKKYLFPLLHVLAWLLLFSMPYLLSQGQNQNSQVVTRSLIHTWVPLFFYAFIFYINYLFLIDRFFFGKRIVLFFIINIVLITVLVWANHELRGFLSNIFILIDNPENKPPRKIFWYLDFFASLVPLAFSIALKTTERWKKTETERKEAKNVQLQSEIQHLKYQLQPHFFFNALNNIYSLVDLNPVSAKKTIHSLGKLMRYLLYDTETEKVPLQKELDFMTQYIELMKLRFTDKIKISYSFPKMVPNIKVVPLLFITLVENAFKHGVSAGRPSNLDFKLEIEATKLTFTATNPNLPKNTNDKSGSGIGLENLEKRLRLLYPDQHHFVYKVEDGIFIAILTLET
ncbi:sensor histidine kinase [Maribacter polysaccharolyticus]|uniref:sensor histidine kinase n=1 Tax=Maribacter polysaccharolyticus TaxID=3020831 RepID=UPI00237F79FE|nr:histidine kinase [Maribacter polysaccharolyticus]MDE3742005.1 histidine kinase [Maribacter polysaccharolyticus]